MKIERFYLHHRFLYYFFWILALLVAVCLPIIFVRDDFIAGILSNYILFIGILGMPSVELKILSYVRLLLKCDPVAYLQKTDYLLAGLDFPKRITDGYRQATLVTLLLNRMTAFCDLEKYEEALAGFRLLQNCVGNKLSPPQRGTLYHNLAFLSAARGDFSFAAYYADEERAIWVKNKPIGKSAKVQQWFAQNSTTAFLLFKQGKISEAVDLYTQLEQTLQTQKKPLLNAQVGIAFEAGQLYYQIGDYAQAVPRLQFAAQNGGTTFYCARAKEMLAKIGNTNFN